MFGGFDETNFAGNNIHRLELVEEEARYIRNFKEELSYLELNREVHRRKRIMNNENEKDKYKDILEMVNKKQKQQDHLALKNEKHPNKNNKEDSSEPEIQTENSMANVFRGFSPLPDPFLDEVNRKVLRMGRMKGLLNKDYKMNIEPIL